MGATAWDGSWTRPHRRQKRAPTHSVSPQPAQIVISVGAAPPTTGSTTEPGLSRLEAAVWSGSSRPSEASWRRRWSRTARSWLSVIGTGTRERREVGDEALPMLGFRPVRAPAFVRERLLALVGVAARPFVLPERLTAACFGTLAVEVSGTDRPPAVRVAGAVGAGVGTAAATGPLGPPGSLGVAALLRSDALLFFAPAARAAGLALPRASAGRPALVADLPARLVLAAPPSEAVGAARDDGAFRRTAGLTGCSDEVTVAFFDRRAFRGVAAAG